MTEKGQVIGDACPGSGGLAGAVYLKTAAMHPGVCKRLMLVYQKLQWVGFTSPTVPLCRNTASLCLSQTTWHLRAVHHGGGLRCRSSSFLHIILSCYLIPAKTSVMSWFHNYLQPRIPAHEGRPPLLAFLHHQTSDEPSVQQLQTGWNHIMLQDNDPKHISKSSGSSWKCRLQPKMWWEELRRAVHMWIPENLEP